MKRPHLFYLLVFLQCAMIIGLAVLHFGIESERIQQREIASQLVSEQKSIRDQLAYARADLVSKLAAISEQRSPAEAMEICEPSAVLGTIYEDRRIQDQNACWIERFVRTYKCKTGSQPDQFISGWEFLSSRSC